MSEHHDPTSASGYTIEPVPFTAVKVGDRFWAPRLRTHREVTVPYTKRRCEETDRVVNFARAAGRAEGVHAGTQFNDSDVFKVIEGASYALQTQADPGLEAELDRLIELIAAAQEDDGYLYTSRTIPGSELRPDIEGPERWSHLYMSHELYNLGHLYEAAAAHLAATGKRSLLDIALKSAALVERVFGPEGRFDAPGHQEIEIGLVKLYRATGEEQLLQLARRFLEARGQAGKRELYGPYSQDHRPVVEQSEAVGHAVRAGYMYSAMADVAALTDAPGFLEAIDRIWDDVVGRKLYLTGGIGARHEQESFGEAYELPNDTAYAETCAAFSNIMWNHRMFLLHGHARYLDVVERTLYNGFLAGVSLEGDRFFYVNPLASDGRFTFNVGEGATRSPWFEVSCCPTNVVRAMPSLPGWVYAVRDDALYVGLYVGGEASVRVGGVDVEVDQQTEYPWQGGVRLELTPEEPADFALRLRLPGWSAGRPVPSDLYRYLDGEGAEARLLVNGKPFEAPLQDGFLEIRRRWQPGDVVELALDMPVRRVLAHDAVEADSGRVAVERGPLVYCAEAADNGGHALDLALADGARLEPAWEEALLGGVMVLRGAGLTLIPYYGWSHRGPNEMAVWLTRS